jgi:hypothetical protein
VSAPRVCLRVDAATFVGWLDAMPGVNLPPRLLAHLAAAAITPPSRGGRLLIGGSTDSRPGQMPPAVAAALAVHLDPDAVVLMEVRDPRVEVLACVGTAGGVAAAVACSNGVPDAGVPNGGVPNGGVPNGGRSDQAWVEVSLLPVDQLVDEALRFALADCLGHGAGAAP